MVYFLLHIEREMVSMLFMFCYIVMNTVKLWFCEHVMDIKKKKEQNL